MFTRRRFLQTLGALALGGPSVTRLRAQSYPFSLGVASGYPSPSSVALWTRLTGDLPGVGVRRCAGRSPPTRRSRPWSAPAKRSPQPEWAHSVHVEAEGLEPERWYWYRFTAGDAQSRIGRTRTAPAPTKVGGQAAVRLRFLPAV